MHFFWNWPSIKKCYKITEDFSFSVTSAELTNYNLLERNVLMDFKIEETLVARDTVIFSTTRVCAEYLRSTSNVEANYQYGNSRDPSQLKFCPKVFRQVYRRRGITKVSLLASRLSHKKPQYLAWKSDAFTQGTEAQQQIWCNQFPNSANQTRKMFFVTPTWHSQNLYHFLLKISIFSSPAA